MTVASGRSGKGLGRRGQAPHVLVVIATVFAALVAMEAAARVVVYGLAHWTSDPRIHADGYAGAPWVADYYKEFGESARVDWEPFVYWRNRPYAGRFINIDERGLRRTWSPPSLPTPHPRVFVFGGSTVWGTGARDDYTMPSDLARELAARGSPAEVVNYGESGYVSRQSLTMLMTELFAGRVPDVVVFEAGVEDTFAALQNGKAGLPQNERNREVEFNAAQPERVVQQWHYLTAGLTGLSGEMRRVLLATAGGLAEATARDSGLADDVVASYCSEARAVTALSREYKFQTVFLWQPAVFTKEQLTPYERSIERSFEYARPFFASVYGRLDATGCPATRVENLAHLFASETAPMFLDAFHLTEEGNRRLAAAIAPAVAAGMSSTRPAATD